MESTHEIFLKSAKNMKSISNNSISLVVTSPPYPMIEMWDDIFSDQNPDIRNCLSKKNGKEAFHLMNKELDGIWDECFRVLKPGGFACINIGDATRKIGNNFRLYTNHSRITEYCEEIGFQSLPVILWRKQTNAPNKFMGSGMLPSGAYVTLEHEYILIFRKGSKKDFDNEEKENRRRSAFFWEERNLWFSDIWDFKGIKQNITDSKSRKRSGAYPFELAFRLINMYSIIGDTILDPFLGTGTSMLAAMASGRNSIGFEIDQNLKSVINESIYRSKENLIVRQYNRLTDHEEIIREYTDIRKKEFKYFNNILNIPVMTRQETALEIIIVNEIIKVADTKYIVQHGRCNPDSEIIFSEFC